MTSAHRRRREAPACSPAAAVAVLIAALIAPLTGCAASRAAAQASPSSERASHSEKPPLHYTVRFVPEARALEVDVDVRLPNASGEPEIYFMFTRPGGVQQVVARTSSGGERVSVPVGSDGRFELPPGTRAFSYRYHAPPYEDLYRGSGDGEGGLVVAGRNYLVRPRRAEGVTATLRIEGADALLPWSNPREEADAQLWQLDGEQLVDSGFHTFGGRRCTREVPGTRLWLSLVGPAHPEGDALLCDWIAAAAREALTIHRPFPYDRLTVHLVAEDSASPSSLGLLLWSEPPSLAVRYGVQARREAFARDWVAVHELVHVLHPSFPGGPPWLTEGLSTYFTELARARSGRHTELEAWTELANGFLGAREAAEGRDLDGVVRAMREGQYRAVYWAGALIALELDLELRRATNHERGLEDVLAALVKEGSTSTVEGFGETVDALAGRPVFREVLDRHERGGPALARTELLLGAVGVEATRDERQKAHTGTPALTFSADDDPRTALRRAVTGARREN